MPSQILVSARYKMGPDDLFSRATDFRDLMEATRRISTYAGLPLGPMEEGGVYRTDIRIFGLFRCNDYQIRVDRLCQDTRVMESYESNDRVRFWSHRLEIRPEGTGSVWTDHVILDAGALTPVVSRYARFMYRHRHKHRGGSLAQATLSHLPRPIRPEMPIFRPAE